MTKYSPLSVANEFIKLSGGETHMKLQKLVYMAYGAWLKNHDEPFITEAPQVWQYGPVFDSLYHQLKDFRSEKITAPRDCPGEDGPINDEAVKDIISRTWEKYKNVSGARLSDITHLPGSPWHQVAKANNFRVPMGEEIPIKIIKEYFRESSAMAL